MLPSVFGERLFDNVLSAFGDRTPVLERYGKNLMKTDVRELEKAYELDVDLPGFKKDDVKVELEDGYLTITASEHESKKEKNDRGQYLRRERWSGECSRSFYVGEGLRPADVKARFEDGILKIRFPKVTSQKNGHKQIAID